MATPKTLVILLLFLGVISACPDGECRQLFFRVDFTFGNKRLVKHVIKAINVSDFDLCELQCYHQSNCVSINFNVISVSKGLHECELNNATHRSHDNELENKEGYIYKGAESACDERLCENGGTCQSGYTDKGYRCLCPPQWTSDHCGEDVNECENGQTNRCGKYAICNNTEGSYSCHCNQGFVGDGFNCTDVNECENGQINRCDKYAICNNTEGSYSCHCNQGFVGDGFNCTAIIPHPSAWFPLNGTYQTSEIERRITSGSKGNNVHLSLGPDGTQDGSYFFRGSPASSIKFSGSNSKLDIGVSVTILCWLYTYDDNTKMNFLEYKGMKLFVNHKKLTLKFPKSSTSNSNAQFLTGTLVEKGWTFVGVSYNKTTAEAKLWIDGNIVNSGNITANFDSNGSQLLTLGRNKFKGKITQLMFFNLTLTQEQIRGIKGRMKLPAMIFNSTIISNNSFYRAELASFLAPAVGQIESKWKLCYNASANGWDVKKFHSNCDNKNNTVTIIQKKPYIFGGYTDIPWESPPTGIFGETLKAFIFSLNSSETLPPFKCFVEEKYHAIFKRSTYGPSFGRGPFVYIHKSKDESMAVIKFPYSLPIELNNENPSYVLAGTDGQFAPSNYEVFYLA